MLRCCRSPVGRILHARKASHTFEPLDESGNFADGSIALAQAQIRTEPIVLMCIGHCSITNLSGGLIVRGRGQCDRAARFPGGDDVCQE